MILTLCPNFTATTTTVVAESGAHAPEQPLHGDAVVIAVKAGILNLEINIHDQ